jgi:oligopeptide transport system ATP-binding protein
MEKNIKLHVEDLTVSFRTTQGMVRAVRGVTFDLHEGETLAVVGESGSGKSVSSRAIMGILAGNGIIDKGEIIYEDQDLTKISEDHYHDLRGNKIGMIFQDPLSSLNPTMKIGKQITEAMLVNGNRIKNRELTIYHHEYHNYLNVLEQIKILKI